MRRVGGKSGQILLKAAFVKVEASRNAERKSTLSFQNAFGEKSPVLEEREDYFATPARSR